MSQDQVQIAGVVLADATREGCPLTYVSPGFEQLPGAPPRICWAASAVSSVVGDTLLQAVGQRLRSIVRDGDLRGRPGGDEFLMMIKRVDDVADVAADLAARPARAV